MKKILVLALCVSSSVFGMNSLTRATKIATVRSALNFSKTNAIRNNNTNLFLASQDSQKRHFRTSQPVQGAAGANAGFLGGKFLVHIINQGVILAVGGVVSVVATPVAGLATMAALEKTLTPIVEVTSNVVGLGCGIAAGVATGPV